MVKKINKYISELNDICFTENQRQQNLRSNKNADLCDHPWATTITQVTGHMPHHLRCTKLNNNVYIHFIQYKIYSTIKIKT